MPSALVKITFVLTLFIQVQYNTFSEKLGAETEGGLEAYTAKMSERHPIGYLGELVDVANAVLFLASDEARFITGAALTVDGGYTAR